MQSSDALIGLVSSIVTELIRRFVPAINDSEIIKAITSVIVVLIGTFIANAGFNLPSFINSLVATLVSYKIVVSPTASALNSRTQDYPEPSK